MVVLESCGGLGGAVGWAEALKVVVVMVAVEVRKVVEVGCVRACDDDGDGEGGEGGPARTPREGREDQREPHCVRKWMERCWALMLRLM